MMGKNTFFLQIDTEKEGFFSKLFRKTYKIRRLFAFFPLSPPLKAYLNHILWYIVSFILIENTHKTEERFVDINPLNIPSFFLNFYTFAVIKK